MTSVSPLLGLLRGAVGNQDLRGRATHAAQHAADAELAAAGRERARHPLPSGLLSACGRVRVRNVHCNLTSHALPSESGRRAHRRAHRGPVAAAALGMDPCSIHAVRLVRRPRLQPAAAPCARGCSSMHELEAAALYARSCSPVLVAALLGLDVPWFSPPSGACSVGTGRRASSWARRCPSCATHGAPRRTSCASRSGLG